MQTKLKISLFSRYIGFNQFLTPMLLLREPELVKQICIKDFDTFSEHRTIVTDDADPLWSKNLFALKGMQE